MAFSLHQHGHSHGGKTHTSTGDSEEESHHSHRDNINVRAAFIHVIGDFIQSFGVLLAALVIYFKVGTDVLSMTVERSLKPQIYAEIFISIDIGGWIMTHAKSLTQNFLP